MRGRLARRFINSLDGCLIFLPLRNTLTTGTMMIRGKICFVTLLYTLTADFGNTFSIRTNNCKEFEDTLMIETISKGCIFLLRKIIWL